MSDSENSGIEDSSEPGSPSRISVAKLKSHIRAVLVSARRFLVFLKYLKRRLSSSFNIGDQYQFDPFTRDSLCHIHACVVLRALRLMENSEEIKESLRSVESQTQESIRIGERLLTEIARQAAPRVDLEVILDISLRLAVRGQHAA